MQRTTKPLLMSQVGVLLLATVSAAASTASAECAEPAAPSCVGRNAAFSGQQEFDACRAQVEAFRGLTRTRLLCLKDAVGAALAHFNDAVDHFNNRVGATDRDANSSAELTLDALHPQRE